MPGRLRPILFAAPLALALAACGQTPGERAVTGGLLGAGAGATVAGATGGNVATGRADRRRGGGGGRALTAPSRGGYYDDRRGYYRDPRDDPRCYDRWGRFIC